MKAVEWRNPAAFIVSNTFEAKLKHEGGSPGLVVKGGDSRSKGHGFESQRQILDWYDIFSHWFVVKIVLMFVWKRPKITEKEAGDGDSIQGNVLVSRKENSIYS